MAISRRSLAIGLAISASIPALARAQGTGLLKTTNRQPDPKRFLTGDLLWPKDPGATIPLSSGAPADKATDKAIWESQQKEPDGGSELPAELAASFREMSYEDFQRRFATNSPLGQDQALSSIPATGHVALVDNSTSSEPLIIEAMPKSGVQRLRFADWRDGRNNQIMWHARIVDISHEQREAAKRKAETWLRKPYKWRNLNLADERNFYCSKLVWLAYFQAANLALDEDKRTNRSWFVTPLTLLGSKHLAILNDPTEHDRE